MGLLLTLFISLQLHANSNNVAMELEYAAYSSYIESMNLINHTHFYGTTLNKDFFINAFYQYANALDPHKIALSNEEIESYLVNIRESNILISIEETNAILGLKNKYIENVNKLISNLDSYSNSIITNSPMYYQPGTYSREKNQIPYNIKNYLNYIAAGLSVKEDYSLLSIATAKALLSLRIDNLNIENQLHSLARFINVAGAILDPHTVFRPDGLANTNSRPSGRLGISIQSVANGIEVVNVFSNSGAYDAGLKKGDVISHIEYNHVLLPTLYMAINDFITIATGEPNTSINLMVLRGGQSQAFEVERKGPQETALAPNFYESDKDVFLKQYKNEDGKIMGLIELQSFSSSSNESILNQLGLALLSWLQLSNSDDVLPLLTLDLRGNGGGSVTEALNTLQLFFEEKVSVPYKTKNQLSYFESNLTKQWFGVFKEVPLVVLVDQNCASACEMFASYMQDMGRAVIIGADKTFGKGVGQFVNSIRYSPAYYDLEFFDRNEEVAAGRLSITTFVYYRPNGYSVQIGGLRPDIIVPSSQEFSGRSMANYNRPVPSDRIDVDFNFQPILDHQTLAQLQRESVGRWLKDGFFTYAKEVQRLAEIIRKEERMSMDQNTRQSWMKEVLSSREKVRLIRSQMDKNTSSYKTLKGPGWANISIEEGPMTEILNLINRIEPLINNYRVSIH